MAAPRWIGTGVVVVSLLGAACSPTPASPDTTGGRTVRTTAPVATTAISVSQSTFPLPTSTSAPPTTTTTTTTAPPPPTTTTAPPAPLHRLRIEARPASASLVIDTTDGEVPRAELPFDRRLRGPVTVILEAEGHAPLVEMVDLEEDRDLLLWLDRPGQLLHKISETGTAGAPKQVAFTPDNSEVWVTLLNGDGFEVFDPRTGELLAAIDLSDGGSVEVIFNRAGSKAYVSQMQTASVYEIDVASRAVIRRLDTGGTWTKVIALSPDEQTLWASNWVSNDVSEIDLATGEVRTRFRTVRTPRGLYVTPDASKLYVAGFERGEIQVFDLATREGRVIHRSGGSMRHLVGDPERGLMYASDMARRHVLVVDTKTDEVRELAKTDRTPNTIDLSPDGRVLYVSNRGRNNPQTYLIPGPEWGTVVVIDTATGDYLDAIVGGNQTTGLDVSPDGTLLAYSDFLDNRVTVYRIPPYAVLAAGGGGRWEAHLAEIAK